MAFNISYIFQAIDNFSNIADNIAKKMEGVKQESKSLTDQFKTASESVTNLGKKLSLGITAPILALGGLAFHSAVAQEKINYQIKNLVGSAEGAAKLGEQLEKIKMNAPINVEGVDEAAIRLLVMGTATEKVSGVIERFAKISAGSGESMDNLIEAFAVAKSGPEGMSRALMALNRRIPVLQEIQKIFKEKFKMNVSTKDIRELAAQGRIDISVLEEAFKRMTDKGGQFFYNMDGHSKTFKGALQILTNNFHRLQEAVGFAILNSGDFAGVINLASDKMRDLVAYVEDFTKENPRLTSMIVMFAGIAASIGPVLVGLGSAINAIAGIGKAVALLTSPMGIMIAGIVAAAAAALFLYSKFEFVRTIFDTIIDSVSWFVSTFPILSQIIVAAGIAMYMFGAQALYARFAIVGLRAITLGYMAVTQGLPALLGMVRIAWTVLSAAFMSNPIGIALRVVAVAVIYLLEKFGYLDKIIQTIKDSVKALADAFASLFNFDIAGKLEAIKGSFSGIGDKISGGIGDVTTNVKSFFGFGDKEEAKPIVAPNAALGAQNITTQSNSNVEITLKGNTDAIAGVKSKTDGKTNLAVSQNMAVAGY